MPQTTATHGGITLTSTTAPQEVLNKAVGVPVEEKKDDKSSAAAAEAGAHAEIDPNSEAGNQPESEEVRKHKGGWQRRIDKLTKDKSTLEETLTEERLARQRLEARLAGKPAEPAEPAKANAAGADPEPDENAVNPKTGKPWTSWKEFNAEHTRWVVRQEKLAESAKTSQTADEAELRKNFEAHTERLKAAKAQYSDWDEVSESLSKAETVPEGVAMAIVEMDNGPDVIYHLAKNPEVLKEIRGLSELRAITRIGVIAEKLAAASAAKTKAAADSDAAAKAAADKTKVSPDKKTVTSQTADPISPVGGGSSATTVDRAKMSTTDWIKQRNAGQIK